MDAEEAIDKALEFLKRKAGYYSAQLVSVRLEDNVWIIKFDVGLFVKKIVTIKLDNGTGRVIEFERLESESS